MTPLALPSDNFCPLSGAFFCVSFTPLYMADTYASFNSLTITGRLSFAEVVTNNGNEWLAVTLLTELKDNGKTVKVTFNTTNGLMSLFKKGYLPAGRLITVTGHLDNFRQIYFDQKLGKAKELKRHELHLTKAQVFDGGLGPAKKTEAVETSNEIEIDTPPSAEKELVTAGSDY